MEYLIGVGLAVVVCTFAMLVGFDRDRVFYPTLVTVIATYYILFAVIGSSTPALARFCSSTKMISFRTGLISRAMVAAAAPLEFACVTSLIVHSLISITPTMNDTDAHCSGINLASLHDRISEIEDDGLRLSFVY